jgi:hypothetical protein
MIRAGPNWYVGWQSRGSSTHSVRFGGRASTTRGIAVVAPPVEEGRATETEAWPSRVKLSGRFQGIAIPGLEDRHVAQPLSASVSALLASSQAGARRTTVARSSLAKTVDGSHALTWPLEADVCASVEVAGGT